ncbi:unnamed protein product [Rhizoctonia solani]|uniref:Laminin domain protein n=1 Tax=Rhizoctonia solani TaxID=456999 RepID=A0A8H2WNM8_9AGAM|nr:unnamed protein product [Rhizoctonia solani]
MIDRWYPSGQVLSPPELPIYLKNVYDLQPIIGMPSDAEVVGIHAVIEAANKASGIPGLLDPGLNMKLGDHLFSAQMARYRSKYSLVTFPSDTTYIPPDLPTHITINLEPISGAPSDEEMTKVQDAFQCYQELRRFPSMFDARVNMELSQHLFNIHMARYMRLTGESQPNPMPTSSAKSPRQTVEQAPNAPDAPDILEEPTVSTNNAGTGADAAGNHQASQSPPHVSPMDSSNERVEQPTRTADQSNLASQSNQQVERFNQLFERFNRLIEQSSQNTVKANELAEKANNSWERFGDVLGNVNRVLVGIQHALVRNHHGNAISALDCLVNEKGMTPAVMDNGFTFRRLSELFSGDPERQTQAIIDGATHNIYIPDVWVGYFLNFYGIGAGLCESETTFKLRFGKQKDARARLSKYLSSCLG